MKYKFIVYANSGNWFEELVWWETNVDVSKKDLELFILATTFWYFAWTKDKIPELTEFLSYYIENIDKSLSIVKDFMDDKTIAYLKKFINVICDEIID